MPNSAFTFTNDHQFIQGESVRIISNDGRLPDGLEHNKVYFAIVDGLNGDQIQVAQTLNDSLVGNKVTINNLGDTLVVESRVSDKVAGDVGHPIQYDTTENQWYVNVSGDIDDNNLYGKIVAGGLGYASPRTFILRPIDNRQSTDRIYQVRFVIPATTGTDSARPPLDSFILQESGDVTGGN